MLSLHDSQQTRYQLVKTNPGQTIHNWLFFSGGPGADSSYFISLISELHLPGNYWLIDLPMNGNNIPENSDGSYHFDQWFDFLIPLVSSFDNPIFVGHSFGGMLALSSPKLETLLKGCVILNSTPSLWLEEAEKCAKKHDIPLLEEPLNEFQTNPNQATFKAALLACAPYYFTEKNLESGKDLLSSIDFNYHAAVWWLQKAHEIQYTASWIPARVQTLIVGGEQDYICPPSLFKKDKRFERDNIQLNIIPDCGHLPWFEQMPTLKQLLSNFVQQLS